MRYLTILLSLVFFVSCTKENTPEKCSEAEPEWIQQKKEQFSSCACLANFYEGTYKNEKVYEISIEDPLCNGINVVYNYDGFIQFTSADVAYYNYQQTVNGRKKIWSCTK